MIGEWRERTVRYEVYQQLDRIVLRFRPGGDEILHIVGHTDHIGTMSYNQALSERRASAVAFYLTGKGVSPRRMKLSGKGEAEPVADNRTAKGRARNRRVEIHFHATVRRGSVEHL